MRFITGIFTLAALAAPSAAQPSEDVVADWNADGTINTSDYTAFLGDHAANDPWADLNGDGLWDSADNALFAAVYSGSRLDDTAIVLYVPATGNLTDDIPMLQPWDVITGSDLGPMLWDSFRLYNVGEIFEYDSTHVANDSSTCSWCSDPGTNYWDAIPGRAIKIKATYSNYYWEAFHPGVIRPGLHESILGNYELLDSSDSDYESVVEDATNNINVDLNLRIMPDTIYIGWPTNPHIQSTNPTALSSDFTQIEGMIWNDASVVPEYVDTAAFDISTTSITSLGGGWYSIDKPSGLPSSASLIYADVSPYSPTPQKNDPHPLKWDEDHAPQPNDASPPFLITLPDDHAPFLRPDGDRPGFPSEALFQERSLGSIDARDVWYCETSDNTIYNTTFGSGLSMIVDDYDNWCSVSFVDWGLSSMCCGGVDEPPCPCLDDLQNRKLGNSHLRRIQLIGQACLSIYKDVCKWAEKQISAHTLDTSCECVASP